MMRLSLLDIVGSDVAHVTRKLVEPNGWPLGAASGRAAGLKTGLKQPDGHLGPPAIIRFTLSLHFSRGSSIRCFNYTRHCAGLSRITASRIHRVMRAL